MKRLIIGKGIWQLGGRTKKQRGGVWGAIPTAVATLIIDTVCKTFGKGFKKEKKEEENG